MPKGEVRKAQRVRRGSKAGSVSPPLREFHAVFERVDRPFPVTGPKKGDAELPRRSRSLRGNLRRVQEREGPFERADGGFEVSQFPVHQAEVEQRRPPLQRRPRLLEECCRLLEGAGRFGGASL